MRLRKTAIAVSEELLSEVDDAAKERGESRSRYVTRVLRLAVQARRDADVTRRLNELFLDDATRRAQRRTTDELDELGSDWTRERW
jgi:metal-responsive CopG/Arc/MetJ family transcriptional regulator